MSDRPPPPTPPGPPPPPAPPLPPRSGPPGSADRPPHRLPLRLSALLPALSPLASARWLAALGIGMLVAAAVAIVSAQWDALGPGLRLAVLVSGTVAVAAGARRIQRVAPNTATALGFGVAILAAVDAGAATAVGGGTWPAVTLAIGLTGLVTAEVLRHHSPGPIADLLFVAAGAIAAGGAGAALDVPSQVILAAAALATLAVPGRRWAATGWAMVAGVAPAVVVVDGTSLIGQGTLADLGLLGPDHGWAAAIAGLLAGSALAAIARLNASRQHLLLATVAASLGLLTAWAHYAPPSIWLLYAAAVAFLVSQLVLLAVERKEAWWPLSELVVGAIDFGAGIAVSVVLFALGLRVLQAGEPAPAEAVAAGAAALAWLIVASRRSAWWPLVAANAMVSAGLMLATAPVVSIGLFELACGVGIVAFGWSRSHRQKVVPVGVGVGAIGGLIALTDLHVSAPEPWAILAGLALVVLGLSSRQPPWITWLPALALVATASIGGHVTGDSAGHLTTLVVVALVAVVWGAISNQLAPLVLGSSAAVPAGTYQVLDNTVGVEGWGWLAVGGVTLLVVAGILERSTNRATGDGGADNGRADDAHPAGAA